jgi:Delta14-sterol reductase
MSSSKPKSQAELNPKTTEYEFFGPFGALFVSTVCPLLVFGLIFLCNDFGCPPRNVSTWKYHLPRSIDEFWDWKAVKWYFSFQIALVLLWFVLPGRWVQGRPLRDGTTLDYKCNGTRIEGGFDVAFMSLVCVAVYTISSVRIHGLGGLTFLYDHFLGITFAAFLWSVFLATVTYITSFRGDKTPLLAEGGNTGNWIYDVLPNSLSLTVVVHRQSPKSANSRPVQPSPPPFL